MTKEEILKMTPEEHIDKAIQYAELNTPDTEWEKEFDKEFSTLYQGDVYANGGADFRPVHERCKAHVRSLLTSRDTYWKERVEKAYEDGYEAGHQVGQDVD